MFLCLMVCTSALADVQNEKDRAAYSALQFILRNGKTSTCVSHQRCQVHSGKQAVTAIRLAEMMNFLQLDAGCNNYDFLVSCLVPDLQPLCLRRVRFFVLSETSCLYFHSVWGTSASSRFSKSSRKEYLKKTLPIGLFVTILSSSTWGSCRVHLATSEFHFIVLVYLCITNHWQCWVSLARSLKPFLWKWEWWCFAFVLVWVFFYVCSFVISA